MEKKILFLGYSKSPIVNFLMRKGHEVVNTSEIVQDLSKYDLTISFGYKHILSRAILESAPCVPINLHISLLPYNRGAHPNFWAHYDGTPSGVTIHCIDEGIDTGNWILQKEVLFDFEMATFRNRWNYLKLEIEKMFIENYEYLIPQNYDTVAYESVGTFHKQSDLPSEFGGWDCEIQSEINRLKSLKST